MGAIKKWAKKSVKPSNNNYQPLRGAGNQKAAHIKGQRTNSRLCRQASRPRWTRKQQADFGHIWKEGTRKAQTSPAYT